MKLYAITTSERASKGQGGNEFIEILICGEDKEPVYQIDINKHGEFTVKYFGDVDYLLRLVGDIETKGKKQKGECRHFIVKDDYGKEYCQECGKYSFQR